MSTKHLSDGAREELARLVDAHGGIIRPEQVLDWARENPDSELYKEFTWDDSAAAKAYRLEQARQVIRVYLIKLPSRPYKVRGLLSVPSDRVPSGGYRRTQDVLRRNVYRQELQQEALTKISQVRQSYCYLSELDELFAELDTFIEGWRQRLGLQPPGP